MLATDYMYFDDVNGKSIYLNPDDIGLVCVTRVPTNSGIVDPLQAIGKRLKDTDVLFRTGTCQSVGQLPIDVRQIYCDGLVVTGRKYLKRVPIFLR